MTTGGIRRSTVREELGSGERDEREKMERVSYIGARRISRRSLE